tara:strand:+ start:76 stop:288 length:213 start_codon:yes stop_codon:yes gene_type:complete
MMNQTDLMLIIAERTGVPQATVTKVLKELRRVVLERVAIGETIYLRQLVVWRRGADGKIRASSSQCSRGE